MFSIPVSNWWSKCVGSVLFPSCIRHQTEGCWNNQWQPNQVCAILPFLYWLETTTKQERHFPKNVNFISLPTILSALTHWSSRVIHSTKLIKQLFSNCGFVCIKHFSPQVLSFLFATFRYASCFFPSLDFFFVPAQT